MEHGVAFDPCDFPISHRQRIVIASYGRDIERQQLAISPGGSHRAVGLRDINGGRWTRRHYERIRNHELLSSLSEIGPLVECLKQLRCGVKSIRQYLQGRRV